MDIGSFNHAPAGDVTGSLRACADVPDWADLLLAGRPYSDTDNVVRRGDYLARMWGQDDVLRALAAHPRIGERSSGGRAEAALSAHEQGGVLVDQEVIYRLRAGNAEYERRFDHVFLIRAAGRSGHEILAELYRRLGNDDTTGTGGDGRRAARHRAPAAARRPVVVSPAAATPTFYPIVQVVFSLDASTGHHHVPLLLSPFAYTTKHHFLVDLAPYGLDNPNEVFYAADRPYGLIEATVLREGAPAADKAWAGIAGFC